MHCAELPREASTVVLYDTVYSLPCSSTQDATHMTSRSRSALPPAS
jgi:hypothetical protein